MQIMPEVTILGCIYVLPENGDFMRAEGPNDSPTLNIKHVIAITYQAFDYIKISQQMIKYAFYSMHMHIIAITCQAFDYIKISQQMIKHAFYCIWPMT